MKLKLWIIVMNRLEKHSDSVEYLSFDVEESSDDEEVIDYSYTGNVIGGILCFIPDKFSISFSQKGNSLMKNKLFKNKNLLKV